MERIIFISHASPDGPAAHAIGDWLGPLFGAKVFISSIEAGEEWRRKIFATLGDCAVGIVFATPNSVDRFWVHCEIGALLALGKKLIPLCTGDCGPSQWPELTEIQYCFYDREEGKAALLQALEDAFETRLGADEVMRAIKRAPPLKVERAKPASTPTRRELVRRTILEMIESAKKSREELVAVGIANTEFFAPDADELNEALRNALKDGLKARFLFLDPQSESAFERRLLERGRLNTIQIVESCLTAAREMRERAGGSIEIRLAQEVTMFLCANHEKVLFHPYVTSATGSKMPAGVEWKGGDFYACARQHFENLWGERWVLFDFGSLIAADRRRLCAKLAKSNGKQIGEFIFGRPGEGLSRGELIDRGSEQVAGLHEQLKKKFGLRLTAGDFEKAWKSVVEGSQEGVQECLRCVREWGLRAGICADTNAPHWQQACALWPELAAPQMGRFLSYELGMLEREECFYRVVAEKTGRPPRDHVLAGAGEANLEAAARAGFRTIRLQTPFDRAELKRTLDACYFTTPGPTPDRAR